MARDLKDIRKHVVFGVLLAVCVGLLGWVMMLSYAGRIDAQRMEQGIAALLTTMEIPPDADSELKPDMVREYIHAVTMADPARPLNGDSGDWAGMIADIIAYAQERTPDRPAVNPATQSQLMGLLLQRLGVHARVVELFRYAPDFPVQAMVESFSPGMQQWILHDPARNIYWIDPAARQRVSLERVIRDRVENFTPCNATQCGWGLADTSWMASTDLREYFGLAAAYDLQKPEVYLDPERFALDRPQPVTGRGSVTLCDIRADICQTHKQQQDAKAAP